MFRRFLALLLFVAGLSSARASSPRDIAKLGNEITVSPGETAGDVACAFCSVHVHGNVHGDVAVFMGNVTVDDGQNISGDVAIFGGDLHLADASLVGGDVAIFGGEAYAPAGTIHGDRVALSGRIWVLTLLAPFLLFAGIVWLVVYLVRRNRYQFPAYPQGRSLPPRR